MDTQPPRTRAVRRSVEQLMTARATLRPFRGGKRFMANAGLEIRDGELIVRDAEGEIGRFSVVDDGAPYALADYGGALAIVDRREQAIVVTSHSAWDWSEASNFALQTGLWRFFPNLTLRPLTVRADGVSLPVGGAAEALASIPLRPFVAVPFLAKLAYELDILPQLVALVISALGLVAVLVLGSGRLRAARSYQRHTLAVVDGQVVVHNERDETVARLPLQRARQLRLDQADADMVFGFALLDAAGQPTAPEVHDVMLPGDAVFDLAAAQHLSMTLRPMDGIGRRYQPGAPWGRKRRTLGKRTDQAHAGLELALRGDSLIVTDLDGEVGRFSLTDGDSKPAALVLLNHRRGDDFAVVDGRGQAIVSFPGRWWPREEVFAFGAAAGLPIEVRDGRRRANRPPLRPGGVRYRQRMFGHVSRIR